VLPFNNLRSTLMDLTGAQVIQVLEEGAGSQYPGRLRVSGLHVVLTPVQEFGDRVATLPNRTPIDRTRPTRRFFAMAAGGDRFTTLTRNERGRTNQPG